MKMVGTVQFCSFPGETFRYAVEIKQNHGRIWLENKQSKQQWECKVGDVANYTTESVAIPRDAVLRCVQAGFASGNSTAVDLARKGEDDTLDLCVLLSLGISGGKWSAADWKYWFPMKLRALDRIDVLESQMHDLREDVGTSQIAKLGKSVVVVPPGQLEAGVLVLNVHRIEATFRGAESRDGQKRLSLTIAIDGVFRRTTDYAMPGEEIDQTWYLVMCDALNSNELLFEIVQEHCTRPLAAAKFPLSGFRRGFCERKITFRFGPTTSRTTMDLFFSCVRSRGARAEKIGELSRSGK